MLSRGLITQLKAKGGEEKDVPAFLNQGQAAQQEAATLPAMLLATFAERVISRPSEQWI